MAIDTQKLIPHASKGQKISAKSVENIGIIATKLIDVDTILKGSLLLDKMRDKKKRQANQRKKRNLKEKAREKLGQIGKGIKDKAVSATAGMRDWFNKLLTGIVVIGLIKLLPIIEPWLPKIAATIDGIIWFAGKAFNIAADLIDWGYKAYDGFRGFVKNIFGEEGVKKFDTLMANLNNLFNAAIMVGLAFLKFGFLRKIFKRGLGKVLKRGAIKVFGKGGGKIVANVGKKLFGATGKGMMKHGVGRLAKRAAIKMFGKTAAKMFGRIPIVGPLIVGIVSILSGEPVGQALFKTFGAAIGGLLGTFIPIPILGTLIGETIGVFVGDLFYTLLFGGGIGAAAKKLKDTLMGIFSAGQKVVKWVGAGFSRFYKGIPKFKVPDFPENAPDWIPNAGSVVGWGREKIWGAVKTGLKVLIGPLSLLMGKEIPNLLWLMNPLNYGKLLVKSFFPPSGESEPPSPSIASTQPESTKKISKDSQGIQPDNLVTALKKRKPVEKSKESKPATLAKEQPSKSTDSLESYPSYDPMGEGQTELIPLPPQVIPVGEGSGSISFDSSGSTGSEDPFESLYAGGLV